MSDSVSAMSAVAGAEIGPLVVAVVGATAVGKTELALQLSQSLGGEIVNADSMQVYVGMDIGTAKTPADERRGIPHHLFDIWDVTAPANVAEYQQRAREAIADIRCRGRVPVVVGGSGLYVRAIFDNLEFPGTDPQVRASLQAELDKLGAPAMHAKLMEVDPKAAAAILPTNGRRIIRALEVVRITGEPFSANLPAPTTAIDAVHIGVRRERDELDARINSRVDAMWADGLVDEVAALAGRGLREGVTARQALGYAQVLKFLDGDADEFSARESTKTATRKFARRQESWFGRDAQIQWLSASADGLLAQALDVYRIAADAAAERA